VCNRSWYRSAEETGGVEDRELVIHDMNDESSELNGDV